MQLGIYSFGDRARRVDGETSSAQAQRNLLEAIQLADQVGLDYFGIGEHHTELAPASAAATILAGAATTTSRILLGSAVTVLSTDDPVRVYQQFATLDALSNGRAEITAGRGSSTESYPLFGYRLEDYDRLYSEKLDLLMTIDAQQPVTWTGTVRPALRDAVIVPRPDSGHLPIWLGTGGSPGSSLRAGQLGLPVAYGIIGGEPARFRRVVELYRQSFAQSGHPATQARVSVGTPGFVAPNDVDAHELWWVGWNELAAELAEERGFRRPTRAQFDADSHADGALFIGDPEQVAARIVALHASLGHMRHFLQMDIGRLPQRDFLRSIELLGTVVKPLVDRELGPEPEDLRGSISR